MHHTDETRHFATSVSKTVLSLIETCHQGKLEVFTRNWNTNKFHMSHSHHIFYKIPSAQWRVLARTTYLEHMRWEKWPYGSDLKTPARHQPGLGFELKLKTKCGWFYANQQSICDKSAKNFGLMKHFMNVTVLLDLYNLCERPCNIAATFLAVWTSALAFLQRRGI